MIFLLDLPLKNSFFLFFQLVCLATFLNVSESDSFDLHQVGYFSNFLSYLLIYLNFYLSFFHVSHRHSIKQCLAGLVALVFIKAHFFKHGVLISNHVLFCGLSKFILQF